MPIVRVGKTRVDRTLAVAIALLVANNGLVREFAQSQGHGHYTLSVESLYRDHHE